MRTLVALSLAAALAVSGCASQGPSSRAVVAEQAQVSQQLETRLRRSDKLVEDPRLNAYVREIAGRIERVRPRGLPPIRTVIVKDADVNAFTPGGGYVFINAGMITALENEAQLAMVLAHEMAHIDRGHVEAGQQTGALIGAAGAAAAIGGALLGVPSELTQLGVGLGQNLGYSAFSRSQEEDADVVGFRYASAAGYNAAEGARSFEVLRRLYGDRSGVASFFSTHPQSGDRMRRLQEMARRQGADKGRVAQQEYLQRTAALRKDVLRYLESAGRSKEAAQLRRNMRLMR